MRGHAGRGALRALALAAALVASGGPGRTEPAGQPAEADGRRVEVLGLGWDDAPTYEVGWFDRVADPATGARSGVGLRGRIGGQLSLDGGHLGGSILDEGWTARLRRGRVSTAGELTLWRETDYKVEFGFQRSDFFLNEVYLRRRLHRFADSVRIGYFDPPVGLDAIESSTSRPLMESPAPILALAPGYSAAVEAAGTRASPDLTWAANLSSVGQTQEDRSASDTALRAVGRLVWRPWLDAEADAPTLLHVGGSVGYGLSGRGEVQFRARLETYLSPYVVDTGPFEGDAGGVVVELAWRRGPVSLQAELVETFVSSDEAGSLYFHGGYVQLAHVLTGESRPYDRAQAVFTRLVPRHPLDPRRRQWGALEVAGRLSWLDLSDGPIRGGRLLTANLGLTWTWNAWVRLQGGYVYARVSDRPQSGGGHVVQARLELHF